MSQQVNPLRGIPQSDVTHKWLKNRTEVNEAEGDDSKKLKSKS